MNTKNESKSGWLITAVTAIVVIVAIKLGGPAITAAFAPKPAAAPAAGDEYLHELMQDKADQIIDESASHRHGSATSDEGALPVNGTEPVAD